MAAPEGELGGHNWVAPAVPVVEHGRAPEDLSERKAPEAVRSERRKGEGRLDAVILLHDIATWTDVTRPSESPKAIAEGGRGLTGRKRGELDRVVVAQEGVALQYSTQPKGEARQGKAAQRKHGRGRGTGVVSENLGSRRAAVFGGGGVLILRAGYYGTASLHRTWEPRPRRNDDRLLVTEGSETERARAVAQPAVMSYPSYREALSSTGRTLSSDL
ncbi:hypothetical protein SCUP234_06630 [Seiridium cupressi]